MSMPLPPGVQVNVSQTPLSPQGTITGQGLAAFALPYNIGPTLPVLVNSFGQFTNLFGTFAQSGGSLLHHSVFQYFLNGGSGCLVCRIPNTDAATATLNLLDLGIAPPAAPVPTTATTGGTVLAGTYGVKVSYVNAAGETIASANGPVTTTGSTSTITIPSPPASGSATGWYAYVTQVGGNTFTRQQTAGSPTAIGTNLTLTAPPTSNGAAPGVANTATDNIMTVKASSPGVWGNSLFVAVTNANASSATGPRFNVLVYNGGTSPANLVETFPSVSVNPNDSRNVAAVINSQFAGSKYITVTVNLPTGGYVLGYTDPAFTTATALATGSDGTVVPSSTSTPTLAASVQAAYDTLQGQILYLNLPGLTKSGSLAPPAAPAVSTATSGGTILAGTYLVEVTYVNSSGETLASASTSQVTTGSVSTITITSPVAAGNATGWYAYVTQAGGSTFTRQQVAGSPTLIGTNLTITAPPTSTGANPPAANTTFFNQPQTVDTATLNSLVTWADGRGDTMIVVDGPTPVTPETSAGVVSNYQALVSGGSPLNADANLVVYAPWLWVLDPSSSVQGAMRYVPPGGAVLAIWDRGAAQFGNGQAPAGTWATIQTQALEVNFTANDIINLTGSQINPIKNVANVGICVFGARTLAVGLPSRYVNIQRTLIQITHDLQALLTQYTFQPNNDVLWRRITSSLTTYLTTAMQDGLLAGSTPGSSFQVLCDSTNNTPTTAQSGYVYATVGVALNSPAEFIVINLQLLSGSSTVVSS